MRLIISTMRTYQPQGARHMALLKIESNQTDLRELRLITARIGKINEIASLWCMWHRTEDRSQNKSIICPIIQLAKRGSRER